MAVVGISTTYAGPLGINPGDYLNPDGTVSIGLMPNLGAMGSGTASSADGLTGSFWGQRNYYGSSVLNGATVTNNLPQTSTPCAANCQGGITTAPPYTPGTAVIYSPPNAPEFDLLGDRLTADTASSANAWVSTTGASQTGTLTIPVGIFGVTSVATMLNNTGSGTNTGTVCVGANNGLNAGVGCTGTNSYAYLTLSFSTTPSGSVVATEIFALMNGVTQRNILNAAGENTIHGYQVADTFNSITTNYDVLVGNAYSSPTSNNGTMLLDYQVFPVFAENQSYYLTNVLVTSVKGSTNSQEVLSAITVATPEPSTVAMFLGGLGVLAVGRFRRRTS